MSTRRRCGTRLKKSAVALVTVAETGRLDRPVEEEASALPGAPPQGGAARSGGMGNENDEARAEARWRLLKDLDDDFTAALSDPAHDIVEQVRNGTLTRAKAEDWARDQGRPPFAGKPDPATFQPREKRYWTLAQMASWAIWRTDDAVRGVSEEYVSRCVEWVEAKRARVRFVSPSEFEFTSPTDRVGYKLGSPKVATAHDVIESARYRVLLDGSVPMLSPERAQHEILDALQIGDPLVARHGEGEAIDRFLWDGLLSFDPGDGPHDAISYPSGKVVRFHRVRVEKGAVLKMWPPVPGEAVPTPAEGPEDASAPEVATLAGPVEVRGADTSQGAEARAAKFDHAQRRIVFLRERVPDLSRAGALAALRRHSDEYQKLHGKGPVGNTQHGKDIRALRTPQK